MVTYPQRIADLEHPIMTMASSQETLSQAFRPYGTSFFNVDGQISRDGMYADVRRYGYHQMFEGQFPSPAFVINFNLKPRPDGSLTLRPIGQQRFRTPGNIVFIPAGPTFAAHCEPSEQHDLCVRVDPARAEHLLQDDAHLGELDPCIDVRNRNIQHCLTRLADEVAAPGFASEIVAESLITLLMVEMYRHLGESKTLAAEPFGKMAKWRLVRVIERLHDTVATPISITELAAEFGISPRHLIRTFKNTTGTTLSAYVSDLRIQRARELLARNELMIKQISASCGFRSAAAFSAAFRAATGQTPRQFQEQACFTKK